MRPNRLIVDEVHKISACSPDKTMLAFDLGKARSERTEPFLLKTATPHKGDPETEDVKKCFTKLWPIQNPGKLPWERVVRVEHFCVKAQAILEACGGG